MDSKFVEAQLRNHFVRQGVIYRRTKFFQEWRERWMILTMNYIFVFKDKNHLQLTQYIDLRDVKSYKSTVRKDEDMIPTCFRISTTEDNYYFGAKSCYDKWSWIVSFERLMDFKYSGKSPYNSFEDIKTKGFISQEEYERGSIVKPLLEKTDEPRTSELLKKSSDKDYEKLTKELQEKLAKIQKRESEILKKSQQNEQVFVFELNKLKKLEEGLKEMQLQAEEKTKKAEAILANAEAPKEVVVEKIVEVIVEKPVQVFVDRPVEVIVQKKVEVAKPAETVPAESKQEVATDSPGPVKQQVGKLKVSDIARMFQNKIQTSSKQSHLNAVGSSKGSTATKQDKKSRDQLLYGSRKSVVVNLFEQFHSTAFSYVGLKPILEFLIKIGADRSLGYQMFIVAQCKASENRFFFAEILLQLIADYKDYENSDKLCKTIEVLIFQAPGIFKANHLDLIKRKLIDLLEHNTHIGSLSVVLKTMHVVHKLSNYAKSEPFKKKLQGVVDGKGNEDAKNWAKKLLEDQ